MRQILFLFIFGSIFLYAQNVGIGTSTPDNSAILELQSTDKGFLLPRVADTNAIASPVEGLMIYDMSSSCLRVRLPGSWSACFPPRQENSLLCNTINVTGDYFAGMSLTSAHTITLQIDIKILGTYQIRTDTVNGYSFANTITFTNSGIHLITLYGSGTPISGQTDTFKVIYTGSPSDTCRGVEITVNNNIPRTCKEWLLAGHTTDGVYSIDPDGPGGNAPVNCYCDMTTDGGGWTLVTSTFGSPNDHATAYYSELTTLSPANRHDGLWDGLRSVITGNSDIRFSARVAASGNFDVDLAFYNCSWYSTLTSGATDAAVCFYTGNGAGPGQLGYPARKNILNGATRPAGDVWNAGYLEAEDACGDTNDFTVDFDDRGMDSNQTDGTDWGEDDGAQKCGNVQGSTNKYYFIWVREL